MRSSDVASPSGRGVGVSWMICVTNPRSSRSNALRNMSGNKACRVMSRLRVFGSADFNGFVDVVVLVSWSCGSAAGGRELMSEVIRARGVGSCAAIVGGNCLLDASGRVIKYSQLDNGIIEP